MTIFLIFHKILKTDKNSFIERFTVRGYDEQSLFIMTT